LKIINFNLNTKNVCRQVSFYFLIGTKKSLG